jgi:SAM-dependent methyltransferase
MPGGNMLKDHEDAYGYEIFDHFLGKEVVEIVERDDGFIDASAGPLAYFLEYEDWPEHYKEAMNYVRGNALDIGCGAGRISLYLQEKGHDVLGIDISPKAVEVCKLRGVVNAKVLSITQITSKLGKFGSIIMMGNNFGLFANSRRAKWLLRRFYGITPKNGRIIAETNDIYTTDDPVHLAYHKLNRNRGRMAGQIRLRVRHKKMKTPWFDYLMVSKDEMNDILKGTGWYVSKFIDSKEPMYIAIIEKTSV